MTVKEIMQLFHRKVGRGREADIEDAIGKGRGYLRKCRYRESMDLGVFLEALNAAGIHPGQFFTEAFGDPPEDDDFEPPASGTSKTVTKARRRHAAGAKGTVSRADLVDLDVTLRYDDPGAVIEYIDRHIEDVGAVDIPFVLGIYASACKPLLRRSVAHEALWHAIRMSVEDPASRADLLLRRAHISASLDADYEAALRHSANAALIYTQLGDYNGLGKSLANLGNFHFYKTSLDAAQNCFETSLRLLSPTEDRYRSASLQGLGAIYGQRSQRAEALRYFESAAALANSRMDHGKIIWTQAQLLSDPDSFQRAFDILEGPSPVDASLVACEHARVLLSVGRVADASSVIEKTRRLLEPLREHRNPIALAALRDLLCRELEGHSLTAQFLDHISSILRKSSSHQVQ